jgi:outer membrane protein assembly factor BamA
MKWYAILIACSWLLLSPLAGAQRRPAPAKADASTNHKLLSVKATGSTRYADKEILAASGLRLGQATVEGDLKESAQQLLASGVFADVAYTFSYSEAGIKVEFQLTDLDRSKLTPARFENFVGIDEEGLRTALKQQVPLFQGTVPLTGQLTDQITHALQGLLDQRHLPGEVDSLREGESDDTPPTAIVFRVRGLSTRIHGFEFPGASPDQTASLESAVHRMIGGEYSDALIAAAIKNSLLPVFFEHGYLKAAFGSSETRVVSSGSESKDQSSGDQSDEVQVDVILPVTAGKQYSLTAVNWKGMAAVPQNQAASLFHLTVGQPVDGAELARDLETLTNVYHSRGFMTAKIIAEPQIDETMVTVRYTITVAEGDLYRMGELEFLGVDSASKERLLDAWKLPEGQPYNPDYTRRFLETAPQLLPKGLQYSTKLSEDLDAKAKAVDVTIRFKTD